jgi:hypothetical protein
MNRNFYILTFVVMSLAVSFCHSGRNQGSETTQTNRPDTGKAIIFFREYEHDFGKVTEGEKVAYTFNFNNQGTAGLFLTAVRTTCGCTVPKYERKPVPPGKDGYIEIEFDTSGRNGKQTKIITVESNAKVPVVLLKITADVETSKKSR